MVGGPVKPDISKRSAQEYLDLFFIDDDCVRRIRAYGETLDPQELADEFYIWLAQTKEFSRFFPTTSLLQQVADDQRAYWHGFWACNVDEAYLESRRHVGQTHARIRLPLQVYIAAMNAVRMICMITLYKGHLDQKEWGLTLSSMQRLLMLDLSLVTESFEIHRRLMGTDLDVLIGIVRKMDHIMGEIQNSGMQERVQEALERHGKEQIAMDSV